MYYRSLFHLFTPKPLVAREGLLLATQRGLQNIILECNSLQIVSALQRSVIDLSDIGHIIEDLKVLLLGVTKASTSHVRHQANKATHCLAHFALSSSSDYTWFEEPPDIIIDVLLTNNSSLM
ncbi:unnamed protein product [Malus baccata var. baccata]